MGAESWSTVAGSHIAGQCGRFGVSAQGPGVRCPRLGA